MAAVTSDTVTDLIKTTLKNIERFKWTDIATELQRYHALPHILRDKKVKLESGQAIQWSVQVKTGGAAKNVGLFEVDDVNYHDTMQLCEIPWRHTNAAYAIERRLVAMNRSPSKIVDMVKTQRTAAMIDTAELFEENWWTAPTATTQDKMWFGVPYWIVRKVTGASASTSTGEFGGANPTGFTAGAGGLSSTTYPHWANWTQQYVNITSDDLVKKMRKAQVFTDFESPVQIPTYDRGENDYVVYMNYKVLSGLEDIAAKQNDKLGFDVAATDGKVTFRRQPCEWVPYLEDDSAEPVYFINWSVFYPVFLEGEYMNENVPKEAPRQHTVNHVHIDFSGNFRCHNRRRQAVLSLS